MESFKKWLAADQEDRINKGAKEKPIYGGDDTPSRYAQMKKMKKR
jgi:hypothetical protein